MVWGAPVDYQFLEVNPAFERQTGLLDAEGKWMRTLAPEHEQHWFDIYGSDRSLPVSRFGSRGQPSPLQDRWYEVYAFPIGERSECQVAILFNDISERKRSEAALEQANRELEQTSRELRRVNEELEQFVRVAGHDLKAPLSNIIRFTQLLAKRLNTADYEADTQEILQHIVGSGNASPHSLMTCFFTQRFLNRRCRDLLAAKPVWRAPRVAKI